MNASVYFKSRLISSICLATDRAFVRARRDPRIGACLSQKSITQAISVAFVKQASYTDLYSIASGGLVQEAKAMSEVYASSNFRSGPVGLLPHFHCDFIVVHCEDSPECKIWEYRLEFEEGREPSVTEHKRSLRRKQEQLAVKADSIDWSKYDLVVCMENAVPSAVASQYPETVWATMLEWFGMPQFKSYLFRPPVGYDVFLTQCFASIPFDGLLPSSALHWPYGFVHSSSFRQLGLLKGVKKSDTLVLDRNAEAFREQLDVDTALSSRVSVLGGLNIQDFAKRMAEAKYYSSFGTRRLLWGNGTLDTAALGALILTDRSKLINPSIVGPDCHVENVEQLICKVHALDADEELYQAALEEQRQRLDYFAFWRPLFELHAHVRKQSRHARITEKLEALFNDQ